MERDYPEFAGRNVFVTGGASGIGESICRAFSQNGARLFIHYNTSKERADVLARELGGTALRADLSKPAQVDSIVRTVLAKTGGGLDVLINNAGAIDWVKSFEEITPAMWERVFDANLKSTFLTTKAFAKALAKNGGSVVNLSSTGFFESKFPAIHYNASKAGVVALTKSFARQLAPKVRVNSVAPGFIQTNFQYHYDERSKARLLDGISLGRFGVPNDVASPVLFLASRKAGYVTGQTLVVDGGRVMIP